MLDIFKIESNEFEDGYSLLDANYTIDESNALTMQKSPDEDTTYYVMTNKRYIKDDPVYLAKKNIEYLNKNYPNKILAVNADLIGKSYEIESLGFLGSEFNIALEEFKIGHYPEYILNTSLNDFLEMPHMKLSEKLWFDIKSKKNKNISYSLNKFEELDEKFNLKNRVLFESYELGLEKFTEEGWNTLYYIHPSQFPNCKKDAVCAKNMLKKILLSGAKNISFFFEDYNFIKKELEPILPSSFGYHTFGLPSEYSIYNENMINKVRKSDVFNDIRVKTILMESGSRYRDKL
jgi:hypothetical protein